MKLWTALAIPLIACTATASTIGGGLGGGLGTSTGSVTSVSTHDLPPIFTTTVANATTTPDVSYTLSTAGANTAFANCTASPAAPSFSTITSCLDSAFGSAQGDVLYRGASGWAVLAPGTTGQVLTTQGVAANPQWATGSTGTVTVVSDGSLSPLFTTSVATSTTTPAITHALSNAAANTAFANCTAGSAAPSFATLTTCLDSAFGTAQGDLLYRSASGWSVLTPGTSGQYLQTQGAAANPLWSTVTGTGTVTSVSDGNLSPLFTSSVATSTTTPAITHALSNAAANTAFANCTAGSTTPSFATLTTCLDSAFGSAQGDLLYRSASGWSVLTPGTSGQYLQTQGASANPLWSTVSGTGSVTSFSSGPLSPLFTSSVATSTTTPSLTFSLSNATANTAFANCTAGTTAPSFSTLTTCLDSAFGSTQGSVMYRSATAWSVLTPGTSGQYLETLGAGANPTWNTVSAAGTGTVTSVSEGNLAPLFTTTVATPTSTPAISHSLSTAAANTEFANCTNGVMTPAFSTISTCLDSAVGSTQGTVMYRSATGWTALPPGTSGQYLETLGAGANPTWNTVTAGVNAVIVDAGTDATMASTTTVERCNSATPMTVTLPTSGMVVGKSPYPSVININNGTCTVDAGAGHTINGVQTFALDSQYRSIALLCTSVTSGVCNSWNIQ